MPQPDEPPAAHDVAPHPGTSPLRSAAHGLWLGPVTTAVAWTVGSVAISILDHDGGLSGLAAALWFGGIVLVVGLPISLLCGGAVGLVAGWAARLLSGTRVPLVVRAGAGGLAAAATVGLPLATLPAWGFAVLVIPVCLTTGVLAVRLASRPRSTEPDGDHAPPRRRAGVWLAAAVAAGLAAWSTLLWRWFKAGFQFEPEEWCAIKLGTTETRTVFVGSHGFPPTSWCLEGDRAVQIGTPWHSAVIVGLLVATVLCALVWLVLRRDTTLGTTVRWSLGAAVVTLVALGTWWGLDASHATPPDSAIAMAAERAAQAEEADAAAAQTPQPRPAPTPTPTATPEPVSLDLARTELDALQAQAQDAGGSALLWQQPMTVTEIPCTDTLDRPGTALKLYGRFTTRDLATASDNADFLFITQDNERLAEAIVTAWNGGGIDGVDITHGEYSLVPATTTTVERADVGFDQGVGELRATSACAISEPPPGT